MLLCQRLASFLAWVQIKICTFSLGKNQEPRNGWPHHKWIHRNLWMQDAFYQRKQKASEPGIPAKLIFLQKTWNAGVVGRITWKNLQSHWTQDAFYSRKQKESERVAATHLFLEKRCGFRERLAACNVNLQSHGKTHFAGENTRILHFCNEQWKHDMEARWYWKNMNRKWNEHETKMTPKWKNTTKIKWKRCEHEMQTKSQNFQVKKERIGIKMKPTPNQMKRTFHVPWKCHAVTPRTKDNKKTFIVFQASFLTVKTTMS